MSRCKTKSLEESIIAALSGDDLRILPFLPYLLQDLWEMGAAPGDILQLVQRNFPRRHGLKILDLGCGKGAVSIQLAAALDCFCHGIDAVPAFIEEAHARMEEYGVANRCRFECGDIRSQVDTCSDYDIIVLGAVGPVYGDLQQTLTTLSGCFNEKGAVVVDDIYTAEQDDAADSSIGEKSALLYHIDRAGMVLADEIVHSGAEVRESNREMLAHIEKRARELMIAYPQYDELFKNYLTNQRDETDLLERVYNTTMFIKKRTIL